MKTAREWFKMLPEPYRKQALDQGQCLTLREETICDTLMYHLSWDETKQSFLYWINAYCAAAIGEFDKPAEKPLPKTKQYEQRAIDLALEMARECKISKYEVAYRLSDVLNKKGYELRWEASKL